ncbi:hypothetical protein BpHYR1_043312 [Brachionus plicatilis]|uniref:Uncharacterized protein n=1 Tax=Brachionus plicatilis TaxID=10195 RepID=A0A3M7QIR4_BRAPC|nr:hypothetical protein BpHYR1_043312 [Brachionus plicatilis]
MYLINKLKDSIGFLYYRHGFYPLKNLQSFSSSLEQYKQTLDQLSGLESSLEETEFVNYDRNSDKPAWV